MLGNPGEKNPNPSNEGSEEKEQKKEGRSFNFMREEGKLYTYGEKERKVKFRGGQGGRKEETQTTRGTNRKHGNGPWENLIGEGETSSNVPVIRKIKHAERGSIAKPGATYESPLNQNWISINRD